ncbi:hypothetical protein V495_03646 [Pseudogymnoascus sp. VKM F-4514 (FW-929)]|nr:hypothetical protein V495_03646 [Pseudogymnoascus sp. VKM F-4514 (FW-929)]
MPAMGIAARKGHRDVVKRLWTCCAPESHAKGIKSGTCPKAGDWARRRAAASAAASSTSTGRTTLAVDTPKPCASPACKTVTSAAGRNPGVHCSGCNRTYVREGETGVWPTEGVGHGTEGGGGEGDDEGAAEAEAVEYSGAVGGYLFAAGRALWSSTAARLVAVNTLKKTAKGDEKVPAEKRVYIYVEAEAATTKSKFPKGEFFYSRDWVIGRVLDAAAKSLQVQNVNNQSEDEREKLRVFHVEGGRLLEFGEKVGAALVSGNTIVLLRGVGPAIPNLIEV